jgi:hypothetical protein
MTPVENSQARHFCAAAWSCGLASTQSLEPLFAKCRFFQNTTAVNVTERFWEMGDIVDVLEAWEGTNARANVF